MISLNHTKEILVRDHDLNKILTEEYGVDFYLQQWAFYAGEPVAEYTVWDFIITDDLNGIDFNIDWELQRDDEDDETFFNRLIEEWKEKAKTNKHIAYRPSYEDQLDPQVLLWRMCKDGKLKPMGEVKVYVTW